LCKRKVFKVDVESVPGKKRSKEKDDLQPLIKQRSEINVTNQNLKTLKVTF